MDAYGPQKRSWWSDISTTGKLFLLFMVVQAAGVIAVTILKMVFHQTDTAIRYGVLLLIMTVFLFYFGFHAVKNENKFELFAFIAVSLIIFLYSIYRFANPQTDRTTVLWVGFILTTVLEPTNMVLSIFVYRAFGWRAYRKIGTNPQLLQMYHTYQVFASLVKLDLFLGVVGVTMVGMFFIHGFELYIDIAALVITFGWAILGWFGVRQERQVFMIIFFSLMPFEPVYIVTRITFLFFVNQDWTNPFFPPVIALGLLALVCRVFLFVWSIKAFRNFGRGLKERAFEKLSEPTHTDSIPENDPILWS